MKTTTFLRFLYHSFLEAIAWLTALAILFLIITAGVELLEGPALHLLGIMNLPVTYLPVLVVPTILVFLITLLLLTLRLIEHYKGD